MENINIKEILDYFKSGKFDLAKKKTSLLIKKFPNNHFLYNLFGAILSAQKKFDEAAIYFAKSIKIYPNNADAYNNWAGILADQKKYHKSIEYLQKAIQIKPNLPEAYYNLGNALSSIERYKESINNYNIAIKIKPNYAKAYNNLGNVFKILNNFQDALICYEKAIEIDSNNSDIYNKLAILYCDLGKVEDAKKCFEKAIKLKPDKILYKINKYLLLTPVYKSAKEIDFHRNTFIENLNKLKEYKYLSDQPGNEIELNFYYLAYHNKNNLEVMQKLSRLFRKIIPSINYTSKNITNHNKKRRIKIGFISQHLTDHTVGKLFGGLIKNISKKKFEVVVFHTLNTKKSLIKNEIDASADKVINLKSKIHEQQLQIENEILDIIFYPDIGMSPITYFLAFSRLAPVQIVSWGHTETTGIDTIDYFLSTTFFEKSHANNKYSEKLICLNQIPTYFEVPKNLSLLKNRSELKLPENSRLYGCPQSLFKIHPDFDNVLAEIVSRDTDGYIVLIRDEGKDKFWSKILKKRWSENFPILNKKVLFIKKLSLLEFFSLNNCVDVLLIPTTFGGGNTTIEAMIFGTPSITLPGKYLRTNITTGVYKQMQITNPPVVNSVEEYINLAIELAKDKKKNNALREKSKKAANTYLFKSKKALEEFENFLEKVHSKVK